jgi:osmoprotectant transport system permease protein
MLTGASTGIAVLLGVPLGILARRLPRTRGAILGAAGVLQTIPSLAMLTLLLALLHKIGTLPAIIALTMYALLPIVRNTVTGLEGVSAEIGEAAQGIGMTRWQQLRMVRLPLALPVIVAGVRTAAVMGVGIATLSAFIGAGGLGQFINRGLALGDTRLILLGAVPAAVLALLVDLAVGAAAWALDPRRRARSRTAAHSAARVAALLLPWIVFGAGGLAYVQARADVVIGSKNFTEQLVLGHMMAQLIEEETDLRVDRRFCLGGTMICHGALTSGEIDLYAEYTGTGLTAVLNGQPRGGPQDVYRRVAAAYRRRFDMQWMPSFGINNTYAITVRASDAEKFGWTKVSDLKPKADELRAGFTAEFAERPDGYPGFQEAYGFGFAKVIDMDAALMYDAVAGDQVDVIAAFATDGRIAAYNLRPLVDDAGFFPPYFAAPVVRMAALAEHPELEAVLARLDGALDDRTMQQLNLAVDQEGRSPDRVAREFLRSRGLLNRTQ